MAMLEIQNLHKAFDGVDVLKGVSLSVEKGDVVAILGPSGSGKTTFLRCINFLETADQGELIFDGEVFPLHDASKKDIGRLRKKTAFVFQNYNLFRNKTALQNVTEGLITGRKMHKDAANGIGMRMLQKVGMADKADSYPNQLSGGQQQRTAIGRAIIKNPDILLCDEPTGALDYQTGKAVLKLLQDTCRETGKTVLIITHNSALTRMADRVIHIRSGQAVGTEVNRTPTPIEQIEW